MTKVSSRKLIEIFNQIIKDCEVYCSIVRDSTLQQEAIKRLENLIDDAQKAKSQAIKGGDEKFANVLLGYQCICRSLASELKMWLLLKQDKPNEAWDKLIDAQMSALGAARSDAGFAHCQLQSEKLLKTEEIVFPSQVFISAGLFVGYQECSICKSEYGTCTHLVGKPYWGEFCCIIARDIRADHLAIVDSPADKRCRVTNFEVNGGTRNRMTWVISPPTPNT